MSLNELNLFILKKAFKLGNGRLEWELDLMKDGEKYINVDEIVRYIHT